MANIKNSAAAFYTRMFATISTSGVIYKNNGTGFDLYTGLRCILRGYAPHELIGDILVGDTRCLLDPHSITVMPVAHKDRIEVGAKTYAIENVDINTRQIGGLLLAYELRIRG